MVKNTNILDRSGSFYLRFSTIDQPGVISGITNEFKKNNISMKSMLQKDGISKEKKCATIVVTTHNCNEKDMMNVETPFHVFGALNPKPEHRFFVVTEWMNEWEKATKEILELVENEKMKYRETITKGFENAPQALRDVLTGKNFGKQIIEI